MPLVGTGAVNLELEMITDAALRYGFAATRHGIAAYAAVAARLHCPRLDFQYCGGRVHDLPYPEAPL